MKSKNINVNEASARIERMEKELAALKELVKNAKERPPRKIPYTIDELVKRINDNELEEDLVVGDYLDIKLYTGEIVRVFVMDTQHDEMENGKLADYSFGITFVDFAFKMNDTSTNTTSWEKCKMRNTYIQRIFSLLPESLRNNIVPVKKLTSAGGNSNKIITTIDIIFCFSEVEIYGVSCLSFKGEGKQYKFFEKEGNREMQNHPWLRSPCFCYYSSQSFCFVNTSNASGGNDASVSNGIALGFCLTSKNH